jgi:N-methylhydantoinase A/oxoprolinase/acetone carboxylase beta subunit
MTGCRFGVDVGGTFTDLVLAAPDGRALTRKILSR